MGAISRYFNQLIEKIRKKRSGELEQELNLPEGERHITDGIPQLARQCAAEGMVLLENDGVLPFAKSTKVAVFGRCQYDYFYVGYGSGGDVHPPYKVSPMDALKKASDKGDIVLDERLANIYSKWSKKPANIPDNGRWGHWPTNYSEMRVSKTLAKSVAKDNDVALVIIGRAAGEDRENKLSRGSFYLTKAEEKLLKTVTSAFNKTVVLMDCGNIVDMSWRKRYGNKISALLYAWQGGMESGNAIADVLCGTTNPSGKLTDTVVAKYIYYPSSDCFGCKEFNNYQEDIFVGYRYFETFAQGKVLYPFGFGLSYTTFDIKADSVQLNNSTFTLKTTVTNTGSRAGKEVVQVYVHCPQGKLGKPDKVLVAFAKTNELKPQQSQTLTLTFDKYDFASFDDYGTSGNKSCYVLEEGEYTVYVGNSVRNVVKAHSFTINKCEVVATAHGACNVQFGFYRLVAQEGKEGIKPTKGVVVPTDYDLRQRILDNLPTAVEYTGDKGITLADVKQGKHSLDSFVAQLTDAELEALTRGIGRMNSDLGVKGNAGAYGGILPSLRDKGVLPVITTDGPAGIRISNYTSLLPCGTALASSWNTQLVQQLYAKVGEEMKYYGSDVLLAPGMNIHRNPLCGRNFEYFSEDPVVSGLIASAVVSGLQSQGVGACPKHFACNNQEVNRNYNDSRLSERALREIYLKGFELCVKRANPAHIMTSYNKLNGVWSHYNYDLATTILREEWGYQGLVITDWWMRSSKSPEFPNLQDNAYRVRAQVDVLMPGGKTFAELEYVSDGTLLATLGQNDGITRGEIVRSAKNTLNAVLKLKY